MTRRMTAHVVKVTEARGRIAADCETCGTGVDVPNNPLGRALLDAWLAQHPEKPR